MSKPKMYVVTDSNETVIGIIHGGIPESDLATHLISIIPHNNVSPHQIHHNYTDADGVMRWSYTPNGYDQHFALFVQSVEVTGAPAPEKQPEFNVWDLVVKYYPNYHNCQTIADYDDLCRLRDGEWDEDRDEDEPCAVRSILMNVYKGDKAHALSDIPLIEREIYGKTLEALAESHMINLFNAMLEGKEVHPINEALAECNEILEAAGPGDEEEDEKWVIDKIHSDHTICLYHTGIEECVYEIRPTDVEIVSE